MEPTGVERHGLQNPRGEGESAGSERVKIFVVRSKALANGCANVLDASCWHFAHTPSRSAFQPYG